MIGKSMGSLPMTIQVSDPPGFGIGINLQSGIGINIFMVEVLI